jgi:hypothetical protein
MQIATEMTDPPRAHGACELAGQVKTFAKRPLRSYNSALHGSTIMQAGATA